MENALIEEYLKTREHTTSARPYRHALADFWAWLEKTQAGEASWDGATPEVVAQYLEELRTGRGLSASTVRARAAAVRGFLRFREDRASRDSAPGLRFSLWLERQVLRRDEIGRVARRYVWSGHWARMSADAEDDTWPGWVGHSLHWIDDPEGRALWAAWCEYKSGGRVGGHIERCGATVRLESKGIVARGQGGPEVYFLAVCPFCGGLHGYEMKTPQPVQGELVGAVRDGEPKEHGVVLELCVRSIEPGPAWSGSGIGETSDESQA